MIEIKGEKFYTYKEAADCCNVTTTALYARAKRQGLQPRVIKGEHKLFMNEHEFLTLTGGIFKCDLGIVRKCLTSILITCYNAIGKQYDGGGEVSCSQDQLKLLQAGKPYEAIISYAREIQEQLGVPKNEGE